MSRSELDVDQVFLKKRIDVMERRHFRAEEVYDRVRLKRDATDRRLWIVPSFNEIGVFYKVRHLSLDHQHTCDLYCAECEACIHEFSCDCPDSATKSNFCKHIHVVCLNSNPEERSGNSQDVSSGNMSRRYTFDKNSEEKYNQQNLGKRMINGNLKKDEERESLYQVAKAAVEGLLSELNQFTTNETYSEVIQTMEELKSKIKAIERLNRTVSPIIDPGA